MSHHTLALAVRRHPVGSLRAFGASRGCGEEEKRRIQAGPGGPADSIVSIGIAPSRQGPAPDMSSASAAPTLTALVYVGRVGVSGSSRCPDLGCGHFCGRPQLAIASGFVGRTALSLFAPWAYPVHP
jgi:hypothetical protein